MGVQINGHVRVSLDIKADHEALLPEEQCPWGYFRVNRWPFVCMGQTHVWRPGAEWLLSVPTGISLRCPIGLANVEKRPLSGTVMERPSSSRNRDHHLFGDKSSGPLTGCIYYFCRSRGTRKPEMGPPSFQRQ